MKNRRARRIRSNALLALATSWLAPVSLGAQDAAMASSGLRAELLADIDALESKYVSLAEVMTDHFAWRPAEGVRSVGEVFTHIAGANLITPMAMNVSPPEGFEVASMEDGFGRMFEIEQTIRDPDAILDLLRAGFAHARSVVAGVSHDELDDTVEVFGRAHTKRQGLLGYVSHMHEHLGQAVAYARMNRVVPPWSGG